MPFNGAQNVRHRLKGAMLSVVLFVLAMNVCALSAPQDINQPIRVRIFNMRSITAQQARDYLSQVQVADTVVIIPGTTAVSVTASPEQLVYATSVLKVVDSNEPYEIQFIDIEPNKKLPKNDEIQTKLGKGFSVGTLLEGPIASASEKIIIDRYNGKILLISPKTQTENVVKTIQQLVTLQKEPNTVPVTSEVNAVQPAAVAEANKTQAAVISKPNEPKTEDKVLGEFMNELSEAAKTEAAAKKVIAEPNLPSKPTLAQEQQQPEKPQPLQEVSEPAQQNPPQVSKETEIPNGDEMLDLNLPEKLEIVNLIDLVGRYLKLNYLYDETKVNGSVTVKVQGKIRVRELYSLLESVLKFRGFVMSRKGNLVTIAPSAEALDQDPRLVDGIIKPGDVVVTKVFHLEHIGTAAARKLLGEMKLGSSITEIPETGTLVITEYAFRIQRIEDLLALVDVPGPPKEYKLRVLKYTIAESLVTKIKALAEQLGTVEVTIGTSSATAPAAPGVRARPRPATPQPGQPTEPQPSTSSKGTGVFIDFDKRTNRVLMIGLTSEIAAVDKIIDSLDVPQQDLRVIREYEIQYVDITKVVDALKEFDIVTGAAAASKPSGARTVTGPPGAQPQPAAAVESSSQGGLASIDQPQVVTLESTNSLLVNATPEQHIQIARIISYVDREPVQAAIPYKIYRLENQEPEALATVLNGLIEKTVKDKEGKIQQTVKYTEENIAIVPDKNTFSLIVYASRKNQEWIGNLIKSLDKRRPQVLIDVSLVEITQDNEFNYDLDVITNGTNVVSTNKAIASTAINALFPSGVSPRTVLYEGGYFDPVGNVRGFYNQGNIQALFSLMDTKKYGRVLARPKILVNDNEKGTISTENTTYVSQQTNATLPGAVTGGVAATSDTVLVSTNYTPYTAKIELDITPQISEGELLRLEIKMQRSDFILGTGATQNGTTVGPPDQKSSNVNTIVTVPDGSTIILGGLIKLDQTKSGKKIPGLGDVPIVGALFRTYNKSQIDDKLYIFVKANIIRPEDAQGLNQIRQISKKNRNEFEKDEAAFQNYQEIPGIKAPPIPPKHVLERDANELEPPEVLTKK